MKQSTIKNERGAIGPIELLLAAVVLVIVGLAAYQVWMHRRPTQSAQNPPRTSSPAEQKTYKDPKTGLKFHYPAGLIPNSATTNGLALNITSDRIDDLNGPGFGSADAAQDEMIALAKGVLSQSPSAEVRKQLSLNGNAVGVDLTILRQLDACDVQFTREARIYRNGYQIVIKLNYDDIERLKTANPQYFVVDPDCNTEPNGAYKSWSKPEEFIKNVAAGNTDSESQRWYRGFEQIVSSLSF